MQRVNLSSFTVHKLDLSYNKLGDDGATALFRALHATPNPNLKELNLAGNGIASRGVDPFIMMLKEGNPLVSLDLSHNLLTWRSLSQIQDVLKCSETLKRLNLSGNKGIRSDIQRLKKFLIKAGANNEGIDIVCSQCRNVRTELFYSQI